MFSSIITIAVIFVIVTTIFDRQWLLMAIVILIILIIVVIIRRQIALQGKVWHIRASTKASINSYYKRILQTSKQGGR